MNINMSARCGRQEITGHALFRGLALNSLTQCEQPEIPNEGHQDVEIFNTI